MADEGKQSIFLGLSRSETDVETKETDTVSNFKTAYALFRCTKNDSKSFAAADTSQHPLVTSVNKKKTPLLSYSTEKLLSSLDEADELELTNFITRKLSKGAFRTGSSTISAIDLRLGESKPCLYLCYCCLLQESKPGPAADVTSDELASLGLDGISLEVNNAKSDHKEPESELLVCLIAPADSQLDLFKSDLDQFCHRLLSRLEFELFLLFDLEEAEETNDVVTIAKPLLDSWFNSTTCYISRCVQHLGSDVRYLIHAALTDAKIDIHCSDESLKSDIKRFFQVCSLSGLLNSNVKDEQSVHTPHEAGDLLVDLEMSVQQPTRITSTVTLKIDNGGCTFENKGCTEYCEEWSTALQNCDPENHSQLRVVIENYKLKAIQDMNTLKRLLKQAETDHYALYRCYIFLKQCGNAPILLQHADQEICQVNDSEMARVLQVLNEHLTQNGSMSR